MKKLIWIIVPLVIIMFFYFMFSSDNSATYVEDWKEEIESRKRYLEHNEESPFSIYNLTYEDPLYFEYDPSYRVEARVNRATTREIVIIGTSDGKSERYTKYAYLEFMLNNQPLRLVVLKPAGFGAMDLFYCAFADKTSGESTYGGGRYLDVKIGKSDKVTLDFNYAYNPYCAYAADYSCPLPPAENILPVAIKAGEKAYKSPN